MENINNNNIKNKSVLLRLDLNLPMDGELILDDTRIKMHMPTIMRLLELGNRIIIISHFGRPKKYDKDFSLSKIKQRLETYIQEEVFFIEDLEFERITEKLEKGFRVAMLENIRFFEGEASNSQALAKNLAKLADLYVNDAFSASHRAHASIVAIKNYLPSFAGLLMAEEIDKLSWVIDKVKSPSLAIIGGSKLSTKLPLIRSLLGKFDKVFIGGAMANNFLKAKNIDIGESFFESDYVDEAFNLLNDFADKIILPIDYVISENNIFDIGKKTVILLQSIIANSKAIIWNGPLGKYELAEFAEGSLAVASSLIVAAEGNECRIIIGGGDTVAVYNKLLSSISHDSKKIFKYSNLYLSTSGGAFLEFLEKGSLVGIS